MIADRPSDESASGMIRQSADVRQNELGFIGNAKKGLTKNKNPASFLGSRVLEFKRISLSLFVSSVGRRRHRRRNHYDHDRRRRRLQLLDVLH